MKFSKKILCVIISLMLLLTAFSGALVSLATETTTSGITMQYYSGGKWNNFVNGKAESTGITAVWIKTTGKNYYIRYRTYNSGRSEYYDPVNSNNGLPASDPDAYAGTTKDSSKVVMQMGIKVCNSSGEIKTGIVVMYRSKIGSEWGKWASNADPDWMYSVKRKYGIEGEIDTEAASTEKLANVSGLEIRVFEESSIVTTLTPTGKSKIIDAPHICQNPKYPTGCESVSTVMALNYAGVNVTVDNFIDNYLQKSSTSNFHPDVSFGGDPRGSGYGCYPPVIFNACDKLLKGTDFYPVNETGASIDYLCKTYIDNNIPVIFWATMGMQTPYQGAQLNYNGTSYYWIRPEHCLLLVGYDEHYYIFNDPQVQSAKTYYLKSDVERAYKGLKNRAVVILEKDYCPKTLPDYTATAKTDNLVYDFTAEGVNAKDGSYTASFPLFTRDENTDTAVSLYYNTKRLASSFFGCGFYCDLFKTLTVKDENTLCLYESPSEYAEYVKDENGDYVNQNTDKTLDRIVKSRLGFVRYVGDKTENYGKSGRLSSVYTTENEGYSLVYIQSGAIISDMTSDAQFELTFNADGLCTSLSDGSWNYGFFYKSGYLVRIVRNGKSLYELRYNDNGVLYRITDGNEKEILSLTFDESGRTASKNESDKQTNYTYKDNTVITETNGVKTVYGYNEASGTVGIVYGALGDINSDGFVDLLDLVRFISEISMKEATDFDTCDINSDGYINALDITLLKNYLLGIDNLYIKTEIVNCR